MRSAEDRGIPQFQGLHQVPYFASAVLDVLCLERRTAALLGGEEPKEYDDVILSSGIPVVCVT